MSEHRVQKKDLPGFKAEDGREGDATLLKLWSCPNPQAGGDPRGAHFGTDVAFFLWNRPLAFMSF